MVEMIYNKVINRSMVQRHNGAVALCCKIFFTSALKNNAHKHFQVITIKEFRDTFKVTSLEDFRKWVVENINGGTIGLNSIECSYILRKTEEENLCLKQKILELEEQLKSKQIILDNLPVDLYN